MTKHALSKKKIEIFKIMQMNLKAMKNTVKILKQNRAFI